MKTVTAQYMDLGSAHCHHMPEEYYQKWETLRLRERRLFRLAAKSGCDCGAWHKWQKASKRLVEHENAHSTD